LVGSSNPAQFEFQNCEENGEEHGTFRSTFRLKNKSQHALSLKEDEMKRFVLVFAIISVLMLGACSTFRSLATQAPAATSGPALYGSAPFVGAAPAPMESLPQSNDAAKSNLQSPPGAPSSNSGATANRLVIQTADLSIVVKDVNARVQAIQDMAKAMGGFVVSVNVSKTYANDGTQVPQAQVVVRVPQESLGDALTQIKKDTVDVQNETSTGTDVTDQYVDMQSRLAAKQAAADQLTKIMQNATKTEDVLAVYTQLQQIDSDIEVLKGQIKYTEQSAALSAISVNIIAEETIKPIQVAGWKPQGVARDAIQSLIYFWQDFVDFLIRFFLYILPVLITIGIPFFLIILFLRWILRITRRPKPVQVEETKK
jgi:hypothetical protein